MKTPRQKRLIRKIRVRSKVSGTKLCPRVSVFRSSRHLYAQIIDDYNHKTLVSIKTGLSKEKTTKTNRAKETGLSLAQKAQKAKISKVVFDRNGYRYHGRVKAFAEGLREGGLKL